ncbi:MAG: FKBP-type peptidyl-prolyl cis-trans isomerase [Gammaproteobacteria bacterium]|nr:FKBP-type peptidyl-prolyl cis-trans isomerase [Gammaproteobacteria bacterium]
MRSGLLSALSLLIFTSSAVVADSGKLDTDKKKLSYTIGYSIGMNLKNGKMDVDAKVVGQAIEEVMSGKKPGLTESEMKAVMQAFQAEKAKEAAAAGEKNKVAGDKFLAENKTKEGVVTLPSGLQYKEIIAGKGKKPQLTDSVSVHYRGTLINGTEFDSSYKRGAPTTLRANGVIKGWQEALQLMPEGAKWQIYVPGDLAYGPRGAGGMIGPNETLIFDIELVDIQ